MDTRNKRASAIMHGLPFRAMLPAPDGTVAALDRFQAAWLYGLAAGVSGAICGAFTTELAIAGVFVTELALAGVFAAELAIKGSFELGCPCDECD